MEGNIDLLISIFTSQSQDLYSKREKENKEKSEFSMNSIMLSANSGSFTWMGDGRDR